MDKFWYQKKYLIERCLVQEILTERVHLQRQELWSRHCIKFWDKLDYHFSICCVTRGHIYEMCMKL
jgi:hypothetical protein